MSILSQADDATKLKDVFGEITPVGPITDPATGVGSIVVGGIKLFLFLGFLVAFFYMMWGAFDWIISGGDSEKIATARNKIRDAVLGMIMMVVVLAIMGVVAGDILGIIKKTPSGNWIFVIPRIGNAPDSDASGVGYSCSNECRTPIPGGFYATQTSCTESCNDGGR